MDQISERTRSTLPSSKGEAIRVGVGYSEGSRSRDAGIEAARAAVEEAGTERCDLVILYSTDKHDPVELRNGVRSVVGPKARLIGGCSMGTITKDKLGYDGYQVGVAAFSSPSMAIDMFMAGKLPDNEYKVGLDLGNQIKSKEYTGIPNILLLYDSVKRPAAEGMALNLATPLIKGMSDALGTWPPAAGVGMMGSMNFNTSFQWFDDRIEQHYAMALVLSGGVRMDTVIMHGCKPSGRYHTITKVDGNVVLGIDGKPALNLIAELVGPDVAWEAYPLFVTLGVNRGDKFGEFREEDYTNHLCMAVDKDRRALVMFEPNLAEGAEVQLMRRSIDFEYIGQRAEELYRRVGARRPFFALYIDCAGRAGAYCGMEREEAEEVQRVIGVRVPLLGMYSGVEIAKVGQEMQALDWTGVLCLLSE